MKLNTINSIDGSKGDFLLLVDYGCEGMTIAVQRESLEEIIKDFGSDWSGNKTVVKLVEIDIKEN
jgi:hypothetical protein